MPASDNSAHAITKIAVKLWVMRERERERERERGHIYIKIFYTLWL